MTKNQSVAFDSQTDAVFGEINITTGVLENIAAEAASEIPGVISQAPKSETGKLFRMEGNGVNAKIHQENQQFVIDVSIKIRYGYSVPEVALDVQERIKEQILYMTDIVVGEVNVHVLSIETDHQGDRDPAFLQLPKENAIETGE